MNMSVDLPDYLLPARPEWAENPYILAWWSDAHDQVVEQAIEIAAWDYPWFAVQSLVAMTPERNLQEWRATDPVCQRYAWENVLAYFVVARARATGRESAVTAPRELTCLRCGSAFKENSLTGGHLARLGPERENIKYCKQCCDDCLYDNPMHDRGQTKASIRQWVRDLADLIQAVPPSGLFDQPGFIEMVSGDDAQTRLMELGSRRPTLAKIRRKFGGPDGRDAWFKLLVASGVLEDGTQHTVRGIRSVAKDGHVCLSLAERTIDDWLSTSGIAHTKEPAYPEGNFRADFLVNGCYIEYFGLVGDAAYDAKIALKRKIAVAHDMALVEVFPKDMAHWAETKAALLSRLGVAGSR